MPSTEQLNQLDLAPDDVLDRKFYRGRGCALCNNTGFKGRTGLYELMVINDQLRALINHNASTEQIRDVALQTGMTALRNPAWRRSTPAQRRSTKSFAKRCMKRKRA